MSAGILTGMTTTRIEIRSTPLSYEAYLDGSKVGHLTYARHGDVLTVSHTEVDEDAEGEGIGSALARAVLDDAREAGRQVDVQCPFVKSWIDRHPDYADLMV